MSLTINNMQKLYSNSYVVKYNKVKKERSSFVHFHFLPPTQKPASFATNDISVCVCLCVCVGSCSGNTLSPWRHLERLIGYCRWNKPRTHHTKSLLFFFMCLETVHLCSVKVKQKTLLCCRWQTSPCIYPSLVNFLCLGQDVRF